MVTAILHHAFPKLHNLLFAHEFPKAVAAMGSGEHVVSNGDRRLVERWRPSDFSSRADWEREMLRLGAVSGWRVTDINEDFKVSPT